MSAGDAAAVGATAMSVSAAGLGAAGSGLTSGADSATSRRVGRRSVRIPNPDKVMFPELGLTKDDLVDHYQRVASVLLGHLRGRPLMLLRHPDGVDASAVVQQAAPSHVPDWVTTATVPRRQGGSITHVLANDAASLAYLAGQAVITPHAWTSRADQPRRPDRIVFDLDPSVEQFDLVRWAARTTGALLQRLGLRPLAMVTGSRGIHVVAPIRRSTDVDEVRRFARGVAELLAASYPDRLTVEHRTAARGDRVYLDVMRNGYGQTSVPPWTVRALATAPVAVPLTWDELDSRRLRPDSWTITDVDTRLRQVGDPWKAMGRHAVGIGPATDRLEKLDHRGL